MKHFAPNSFEAYYRARWRAHTVRFIAALAILSNCIVWAIVAAFYGAAWITIMLGFAAVFFLFIARIKLDDCTRAYDRMLHAIIHPEDILDDTDTTDHP